MVYMYLFSRPIKWPGSTVFYTITNSDYQVPAANFCCYFSGKLYQERARVEAKETSACLFFSSKPLCITRETLQQP